jgi:hypothetical protein
MDSLKNKQIKLGGRIRSNNTNLIDSSLKNLQLNPGVNCQTTFKTTSKRRAVSFAPPSENEIYEVPHINDYSSQLIGSIWYNGAEYLHIETSCGKIVRKMNSDKCKKLLRSTSDEKEAMSKKQYCARGLERFTDAGLIACRTNRVKAIDAVLDEQKKQWNNNNNAIVEPARIADIYAQHCIECKIDAIYTARRDELDSNHHDFTNQNKKTHM